MTGTYAAIQSNTVSFIEWLKGSIEEHYGERCPEDAPGCANCDAWAMFDKINRKNTDPVTRTKVTCEYSIGGDMDNGRTMLFPNVREAWKFLEKNEEHLLDGTGETFEDLEGLGLLTFEEIVL